MANNPRHSKDSTAVSQVNPITAPQHKDCPVGLKHLTWDQNGCLSLSTSWPERVGN